MTAKQSRKADILHLQSMLIDQYDGTYRINMVAQTPSY